MAELVNRVLKSLEARRQNILNGNINCIPSPFKRFSEDFPGIEQGKYYLISASTKVGKTQLANYLFLYNSVMYAYKHPDKVALRILYFPLEETQEAITLRFMSYLLYTISKGTIRKSPSDLKSVREQYPIDKNIIDLFEQEPYKSILDFFEEHVTFVPDRNPYGIFKQAQTYAEHNGKTYTKKLDIIDNKTGEVVETKDVFDYYEPDNPKEYVMIMVDHIGLISTEGKLDLRESINKLSDNMIQLRNKYNYIPVIIQQQGQETTNLEAYKANKIRPTISGLSDSKYTAKDANVMLGLTNPYSFELPEYGGGYDITKLKGNARFLEVVINRDGISNGMIGLYFDGCTNFFAELPPANDKKGMEQIYKLIEQNRNAQREKTLSLLIHSMIKWRKYVSLRLYGIPRLGERSGVI